MITIRQPDTSPAEARAARRMAMAAAAWKTCA
jgi:hypothetical protein